MWPPLINIAAHLPYHFLHYKTAGALFTLCNFDRGEPTLWEVVEDASQYIKWLSHSLTHNDLNSFKENCLENHFCCLLGSILTFVLPKKVGTFVALKNAVDLWYEDWMAFLYFRILDLLNHIKKIMDKNKKQIVLLFMWFHLCHVSLKIIFISRWLGSKSAILSMNMML